MRVEERQCRAGAEHLEQPGGSGVGGRQRRWAPGALGREQAVAEKERCAAVLGDGQRPGVRADQGADARDPRRDERHVGQCAHDHHGEHVLASDALAQDERVLRTDGGDQREAGEESDEQR